MLAYLVLNFACCGRQLNLLFENISLFLQLDRPPPVVKGAGDKHLVRLVRPAVGSSLA